MVIMSTFVLWEVVSVVVEINSFRTVPDDPDLCSFGSWFDLVTLERDNVLARGRCTCQ